MTTSQTTCRLNLSGQWRLDGTNEKGAALSCAAAVPGDVHSALFAAGLMQDPYWGRNERDVQWVGKHEWAFSREFEVADGFLAHSSVILRLEDCDTFATVFVNGAKVGETHDRFRRWDFDVRGALRPGRNDIRLVFASAWRIGDEMAAASPRPYPMSMNTWFNNGAFIRKPACHRGWDWGLAQMTTGPCGAVELIASDGGRIDYVYCDQEFNDDLSHCTLRVHAILETGEDVTNTLEIDNPPLWWPNGQGEQKFFHYAVPVGNGMVKGRVGLRKIELDTAGGAVCFMVNNRAVFMKGANWIPCDAFDTRQTPERYRNLLGSARAANMNMVRLWGGGQFEKDAFYDLCDELGLLVWHDFMFSCALYPANDAFLADVRAETEHQVRRLRDHACIALWCGDNECIGAARGWYGNTISAADRKTYIDECKRRFEVQEEVVSRCDPSRKFWPSSPCAGSADFDHDGWHADGKGDMHIWAVWHENKPFGHYRSFRPRFCSEFGFQSFPSREVAETFCHLPPVGLAPGAPTGLAPSAPAPGSSSASAGAPLSEDFEWHQKNDGGNERIRKTTERLFRPPRDIDEMLYLSQVQQACAIKTAVETWRTLRPYCMGTLFWQLNDLWPVSSWSSLEYGGKWKHLHHHARRFFAPVAIVAKPSEDGASLEFWGINDTAETVAAKASIRTLGFEGTNFGAEAIDATLPPGSAVLVATRPLSAYGTEEERKARFLSLALGEARNDWFFAPFKESPVAEAKIKTEVSGGSVTLSTDKPAFFVWLELPGVKGEFSDNSFTLLPGEKRTVEFSKAQVIDPAKLSVSSLR